MAGDPNAGTTPTVAGTAYTVFIGDTTATKLYAIDSNLDLLATLPSPNSGRLTTIGVLGVTTNDNVGFDIAPALPGSTGTAYASLTQGANGPSRLYTINLMTGAAALVGTIGVSPALRGIAVAP